MIENEAQRGYLAGIIDGEGYLYYRTITNGTTNVLYGQAGVRVAMTDKDVVSRLREMVGYGGLYIRPENYGDSKKAQYVWTVQGTDKAIDIMLVIRDLVGTRRRERIDEILSKPMGRLEVAA